VTRADAGDVAREYGVPPADFAAYLAMIGDDTDNIPGIEGIGPANAVRLLANCGGTENPLPCDRGEKQKWRPNARRTSWRSTSAHDLPAHS